MGPGGSHPPRLHAGTLHPAWINIFITNTVTCHGPSDQFCKRISHGTVTRQQPGNTKVSVQGNPDWSGADTKLEGQPQHQR